MHELLNLAQQAVCISSCCNSCTCAKMARMLAITGLLVVIGVNPSSSLKMAALGDHGKDNWGQSQVASMIQAWGVDDVLALGDCNYEWGEASTIDSNVGKHFHAWMYPYKGSYGSSASGHNHFWPVPGNHDWGQGCGNRRSGCTPGECGKPNGLDPYLTYMPVGGKRYYTTTLGGGLVQLFALNSDCSEPDGTSSDSKQGRWLQDQLAASRATWKFVMLHHSPYSSGGEHGSHARLQWPFEEWGADAVLSAHDHSYERILKHGGFPYFVNGLGGKSKYGFGSIDSGSAFRYNHNFGAQLIDVDSSTATFTFYAAFGSSSPYSGAKDCYKIYKGSGGNSYSSCETASASFAAG